MAAIVVVFILPTPTFPPALFAKRYNSSVIFHKFLKYVSTQLILAAAKRLDSSNNL